MSEHSAPFLLSFGIKSVAEVERDGTVGLLTHGYASLYNTTDLAGEHQEPGAFRDIVDTWGRQERPLVDFEHGADPILGTAHIGWGTKYELDAHGLYCECFLPRDPTPPFRDNAQQKTARWHQIYGDILRGTIRGYSVQGVYQRTGRALKRWSMNLLTITSRPCLPSATFTLGAKALADAYGAVGKPPDQGGDGGPDLDALLARVEALEAGSKTLTKAEPDGADHPASHYLFVGDPQVVGTWKLRYKDADGKVSPRLLGACHAALTVGYRGQKVDLPDAEKQRCLGRLKRLYKQAGLDWPEDAGSSGQKAEMLRAGLAVLRDFDAGAKAGRTHSAATVAAVRQIADGLDAHVSTLRDHFGLGDHDDAGESEPDEDLDEGQPLVG